MKYGKNILKPKSHMTMTTGKTFEGRHNIQYRKKFFCFFVFYKILIKAISLVMALPKSMAVRLSYSL